MSCHIFEIDVICDIIAIVILSENEIKILKCHPSISDLRIKNWKNVVQSHENSKTA